MIDRCLRYLNAKADPDGPCYPVILNCEKDEWFIEIVDFAQ